MKTQTILLLCALLTLGACKKENSLQVETIREDSKGANWTTTLRHSTFSSTDPAAGKACAAFNDELDGLIHGICAAFIEQAEEQAASLKAAGNTSATACELYITDTAYTADDRRISVLVQAYQYLGGANGNTDFYALNYDIPTGQFLTAADLFLPGKEQQINALLKSHLSDPDKCYTFEAPTLANCSAVNLTPEAAVFTYAKYILGPGACGPATITIPREKLAGILK